MSIPDFIKTYAQAGHSDGPLQHEIRSDPAAQMKTHRSANSQKHFDSEFIYYSGSDPQAVLDSEPRKTPSQRKPKRERRKGNKSSSTSPSSSTTDQATPPLSNTRKKSNA